MTEAELAKIEERWSMWLAEGASVSAMQGLNDIGLLGRALREAWAQNKRLRDKATRTRPLDVCLDRHDSGD